MEKMFVAPSTYVQGFGVLAKTEYIEAFGKKGLLVTDDYVYRLYGERFSKILAKKSQVSLTPWVYDQMTNQPEDATDCEFVIAFGGGKAIDQGKSFAFLNQLSCIVIPTAASTDAPTSRISVEYDETGHFLQYQLQQKNPDLVLVDTALLIQSPTHFLVSGIADGLATYVEARTVWENEGLNTLGKQPTLAALALAQKCCEVLFKEGKAAIEANQLGNVNDAFEHVVEANTLLSGLGFESGGLSIAHALHNGLMSLWGAEITASHGQVIAFTTLVHLATENRSKEEYYQYRNFYLDLELPVSLAELGITAKSEAELRAVCHLAFSENDGLIKSNLAISEEQLFTSLAAHQLVTQT